MSAANGFVAVDRYGISREVYLSRSALKRKRVLGMASWPRKMDRPALQKSVGWAVLGLRKMRILLEQNVRCFCSERMSEKPRRGRDSKAQGAAQRSPGLTALQSAKAPTGRDSNSRIAPVRPGNLGPLGLAHVLFRIPRAAPAQPAPPWAIESRPLWGFRARGPDKNTPN